MPKTVDRMEEEIRDTLARIASLVGPPPKMSERAIEREAGVPQGFLAKLRKGKNRHPNAVESIAKLRKFLVAKGVLAKEEPPEAPAQPASASPNVPETVARPSGTKEFDFDFTAVKSADELLEIDRRIATKTALGELEPKESDALKNWSTEIRQVLELQDAHKAREELLNLVPMTADQAEEFWKIQEVKGIQRLAPGEAAKPPERTA